MPPVTQPGVPQQQKSKAWIVVLVLVIIFLVCPLIFVGIIFGFVFKMIDKYGDGFSMRINETGTPTSLQVMSIANHIDNLYRNRSEGDALYVGDCRDYVSEVFKGMSTSACDGDTLSFETYDSVTNGEESRTIGFNDSKYCYIAGFSSDYQTLYSSVRIANTENSNCADYEISLSDNPEYSSPMMKNIENDDTEDDDVDVEIRDKEDRPAFEIHLNANEQ